MPSSNVVTDGGFEGNTDARTNPAWTSTSTAFGSSLCSTGSCGAFGQSGNGYVWFDGAASGVDQEIGTAQQIITIPTGSTATLSFLLRVATVTAPSTSTLTVTVDGAVVQTINEPANADPDYTQVTIDLSAFASGTPRLLSFNYQRPAGTTGSDSFLIDEVSLATNCGPSVVVSGRVTTPSGQALRNAVVSLIDSQGIKRTAVTSSFGLYSFGNVQVAETYIMNVASKRYRFSPKVLQFFGTTGNVDFVGLE